MGLDFRHIDPDIRDIIEKYTSIGSLSYEENSILLNWLKASEQNKKDFLLLQDILGLNKTFNTSEEFDKDKAFEKFIDNTNGKKNKSLVITIAAIAAVLSGVIFFAFLFCPSGETSITSIENTSDTLQEAILSDNSIVSLNHASTIKYEESFGDKHRKLNLSGEAYFEVVKNSLIPFVVYIDPLKIRVIGTEFNVEPDTINREISISVFQGTVEVIPPKGENIILNTGQEITYKIEDKKFSMLKEVDRNSIVWKTNEFYFNSASLNEIVSVLNDYYNENIIVEDSSIANTEINTRFYNYSIESILHILSSAIDISVEKTNSTIILKKNAQISEIY